MANRSLARKGEGSLASSGVPTRTASPTTVTESPRTSSELMVDGVKSDQDKEQEKPIVDGAGDEDRLHDHLELSNESLAALPIVSAGNASISRTSIDSRRSASARPSLELNRTASDVFEPPRLDNIEPGNNPKTTEEYQKKFDQMQSDYETSELRRQEETHDYLERIDALQSKLQYLTKEAAETAKNARAESKPGSDEYKLAAKDEKITLLLEEGQRLSQTELKHMNIIKKLRAKSTEDDKAIATLKKLAEKHEKAAREAQERAKHAENLERRVIERTKTLPKVEKELETVKNDRDAKASLVQDLQRQLSDATSLVKEEEERAQAKALETERKITAGLMDELSVLKTEKNAGERQHQIAMRDMRDKYERDKERARMIEMERQGEQTVSVSLLYLLEGRGSLL